MYLLKSGYPKKGQCWGGCGTVIMKKAPKQLCDKCKAKRSK